MDAVLVSLVIVVIILGIVAAAVVERDRKRQRAMKKIHRVRCAWCRKRLKVIGQVYHGDAAYFDHPDGDYFRRNGIFFCSLMCANSYLTTSAD